MIEIKDRKEIKLFETTSEAVYIKLEHLEGINLEHQLTESISNKDRKKIKIILQVE
jgi:hypothetical protein